MSTSAESIVRRYFDRIRQRSPDVAELFHEDATLVGLGDRKHGRGAIREFYAGVIENAGPTPTVIGDLLVSKDRVAAEIEIALSDGSTVHVVDLFVVEDELIRSLTYFVAEHDS